jgi:hypothetical protein
MVEVSHLSKDFGGRHAVADVSFSVGRGPPPPGRPGISHDPADGEDIIARVCQPENLHGDADER